MPEKLGQNFLTNPDVVKSIVEASSVQEADVILEIGPGRGILTDNLLQKAKKVVAVELDRNLIPALKEKYKDVGNVVIYEANILNVNIEELFKELGLAGKSYKIVANIPYYITSPIIKNFLENQACKPEEMILMVQKEVAERITASSGDLSILALSVQFYAQVEIILNVPRKDFDPMPKVDSAVIKIGDIRKDVPKEEVKRFFRVVKAGFSAPRKKLIKNLSSSLHIEKEKLEKIFKEMNLSLDARAQELSLNEWKALVKIA